MPNNETGPTLPQWVDENVFDDITSREYYGIFIALVREKNPSIVLPEYEDWVDHFRQIPEEDRDATALLGVKSRAAGGKANVAKGVMGAIIGRTAEGVFRDMGMNNVDDVIRMASDNLRGQFAKRAGPRVPKGTSGSGGTTTTGSGGDGGTTRTDYAGGSSFNPEGFSLNLKPVDVDYKTNIAPNFNPKFFLDGRDNSAPLIMKQWTWIMDKRDTNTDERILNYFNTEIKSGWITAIQRSRSKWNTYTAQALGGDNLLAYFNIISEALSFYYFYASVIAHFNLRENRNEAMVLLYSQLSPGDLNNLFILRRVLERVPIPPALNEFLFNMFGNYKQSSNPGAPLTKLCPLHFEASIDNNFTVFDSKVSKLLNALSDGPFRKIQPVITEAFPSWCEVNLFAYTGVPRHSEQFNTHFTNTFAFGHGSVGLAEWPMYSSLDDTFHFNTRTDALDGWVIAANSAVNATGKFSPGLARVGEFDPADPAQTLPYTWLYTDATGSALTSQVIAVRDDNLAGTNIFSFFPVEKRARYSALVGNSYDLNTTISSPIPYQKYGTTVCLPVSPNINLTTGMQFMDLIFGAPITETASTGSAYSTKGREDFAEESENKRKRRRRRK